jgi:protein ImuB
VSLDGEAALLLEIGASMRLFGGFEALYILLQSQLAELGFTAVYGLGMTPSAARLRAHVSCHRPARMGQIFALAPLPLSESTLDSRTIATLAATGIHTFGELARLPRDGIARRFGQETLDYLARLRGELPETLVSYRPPDRYHAWLELPGPCTSSEALSFPLRRMLGDLCTTLSVRDGGVERFTLRFALETLHASCELRSGIGDICRLEVGLLQASRDPEHLYLLTRARLERMSFPRPVLGIYLEVARLPTFVPPHRDLFDTGQSAAGSLKPLLERLTARLGEDALLRPQWLGDHRPERASGWRPYAQGALIRPPVGDMAGVRPLWLLPSPIALAIDGVALISSAERIESGWWDDGDIRRDYYVAEVIDPHACALPAPHPGIAEEPAAYARNARETADRPGFQLTRGARAWVFQDLRHPERWYLQGWFG